MLQHLCAVILFTIFGLTLGQNEGGKWDGLKVTWGPDPLESQYFTSLPRTSDDAEAVGFKKIDGCDDQTKWRGARYVKDGDYAVVLLYDVNGYIAGIQTGVPKDHDPNYPSSKVQPPFVDDGNHWVLTAYFVDPSTICSTGRSSSDFASQGTGTNLYLQNSTDPEASFQIPTDERVHLNETLWAGGMCFPLMGKHFWYDYHVDSDCDSLFPVFLLYNEYKLNAFGWAMGTDLNSPRFEHANHAVLGIFMKEPPQCLYNITSLTSMHIYMTDNVVANNWQQNGAKWDGLKVTWGPDPLESQYFTSLPRTSDDAEAVGFKKIDGCDGGSKWRGARYVKDGDYAVVLLYDVNGYIAGIQTGVPKGHDPTYPSKNIQPPFVDDGNHWVLTAYFVDPSTICSTGRSSSDFASQGTGTQLYIQNSTNPEASVKIPLDERVLLNETRWAGGMCFPTMGKHFWYDYRVDSDCDTLFPVFLLYNGYKLNAFGWAMGTDLHSSRFEHPSHAVLGMFMKEPPQCMYNITTLTTMHIYMTDNVVANNC